MRCEESQLSQETIPVKVTHSSLRANTRLTKFNCFAHALNSMAGGNDDESDLVVSAQMAFREFHNRGDRAPFEVALQRLQQFRSSIESEYVVNISYVSLQENLTWRHLDQSP